MKILYLTHENIDKTFVSKAMMYDIAVKLADKYDISMISASNDSDKSKRFYCDGKINHSKFFRHVYGEVSFKDILLLLSFLPVIIKCIKKSDVIFVRSYAMMIFAPIAKLLKRKIIFDPRGLGFLEMTDSGKVGLNGASRFLRVVEKCFIALSNIVICDSDAQQAYYEKNYGMKNKYRVVYNGTETPETPETPETEMGEYIKPTSKEVYNIVYVGSLIKWHCPSRINEILVKLDNKEFNFKFHCITKDQESAVNIFSGKYAKNIFTHPYRQKPIKYDLGLCLIEDTLSKSACFPVKFSEYIAARTPVLYSNNVDVCKRLSDKYSLGLGVDLSKTNDEICDAIIAFSKVSNKLAVELPFELTQEAMVDTIDSILGTINN